jgi:hypothetical protein
MRSVRRSFAVAAVSLALSHSPTGGAETAVARDPTQSPAIRVAPGDWGRARPEEVEAVLRATAAELWQTLQEAAPVSIAVQPTADSPEVHYERNARGEYVIALSARDRRWAQYAYQFAHELCHVLANFDHRVAAGGVILARHQWFEEALCETTALFALRRMAVTWKTEAPFENWRQYAPWFAAYADHLLAAEHRRHARPGGLAAWYVHNAGALADDPYLRHHNDYCAAALLPLFEADSSRFGALRYLNLNRAATAPTFQHYLAAWRRSAPPRHWPLIDEIVGAFALAGPRERVAQAAASSIR